MKGKFAPTRLAHLLYAKQTSYHFPMERRPPSFSPYKQTPERLSSVMDEGVLTTIVIVIYFTTKTLAIVVRCLSVESCQKVCDQISRLSDPYRVSFT
jgi:hypothetical protein